MLIGTTSKTYEALLKQNSMESATGNIIFQPKRISWSYRYLGKQARANTNRTTKKRVLKDNQAGVKRGCSVKLNKGNQPPKNNVTVNNDIINIFPYSAKKYKAKLIAEYSTL